MANTFTNDSDCVALWKFDDGSLTTDSIGSNTLTNVGVAADTEDKKEGNASAVFRIGTNDYFRIADADLDEGMPIKSTGGKTITICFWFKLDALDENHYFFNKQWTDSGSPRLTLAAYIFNGTNRLKVSTSPNGPTHYDLEHTSTLTTGRWYHASVSYNNADYMMRIRIWDDTAQQVLGGMTVMGPTSDMYLSDQSYLWLSINAGSAVRGHMDEMVVFKRVLTDNEIDQIRQGLFGAGAIPLAGTLAGTSSWSGDISIENALDGTMAAQASLTGTATILYSDLILIGQIEGESALSASLSVHRNVSGTLIGRATLSGEMSFMNCFFLKGILNAQSSWSAIMNFVDWFPWYTRRPMASAFADQPGPETVLMAPADKGYPLTGEGAVFDGWQFLFTLPFVSQAEKESYVSFYAQYRDRSFYFRNPQDGTGYKVVFGRPPLCRLRGRSDLWRMEFHLIRETSGTF